MKFSDFKAVVQAPHANNVRPSMKQGKHPAHGIKGRTPCANHFQDLFFTFGALNFFKLFPGWRSPLFIDIFGNQAIVEQLGQ